MGCLGTSMHVDFHNFEIEAKVESRKPQAKAALRSKQKLYRRFLMFKDFYSAAAPVVVCEGKTDNIYLLHAIRSLAVSYPKLATMSANNKIALNIRILKTVNKRAPGGSCNLEKELRFWRHLSRAITRRLVDSKRQECSAQSFLLSTTIREPTTSVTR